MYLGKILQMELLENETLSDFLITKEIQILNSKRFFPSWKIIYNFYNTESELVSTNIDPNTNITHDEVVVHQKLYKKKGIFVQRAWKTLENYPEYKGKFLVDSLGNVYMEICGK